MNITHFVGSVVTVAMCVTDQPFTHGTAHAQAYPERPLRFIAPFPAGGPPDVVARIIGRQLSANVGQPVIVDNRAGAGGTYGTNLGAKAPPDGYTITLGVLGPVSLAPTLYSKLPYRPVTEFAPVTLIALFPNTLLVSPAAPFKSVKELVALARAKPGQLNCASAGVGTLPHLSAELFAKMANIRLVHVPYKGGVAALPDLMAGRMDLLFAHIALGLSHIEAGKLAALAVTSAARAPLLPDTPTLAEAGVLAGYETNDWFGIIVPAATPQRVVAQLHGEMIKVLHAPEIKSQLVSQGGQVISDTPAEFAKFIQSEITRWAEVIKFSGARIE